MIARPAVLILGAGASVDCGFPSGGDLKRLLSGVNDLDQDTRTCVEACTFTAEEYADFSTCLGLSPLPSVDLFLENRPAFARSGKLAIAAKLIHRERPENANRIVTFNYDRVLEHFPDRVAGKHVRNESAGGARASVSNRSRHSFARRT